MKIYTLEWNCNTPTKQQINIPTNTDYKVGVKVYRNGKQSILATNEVMLGTLSADTSKTNGYVTFTEKAGDDPAFIEKDVVVTKGYDYDDTTKETGYTTSSTGVNFPLSCTAESLGVAGQTLTLDSDVKWGNAKASGGAVDVDDIASWNTPKTVSTSNFVMWQWPNGNPAVAFGKVGGTGGSATYHFYTYKEDGTAIGDGIPAVIQPNWILRYGANGYRATNNYYVIAWKMTFGEPFTAKFKLNENIYKSQMGDIGGLGSDTQTANLSGAYFDGTTYSYDIVVK